MTESKTTQQLIVAALGTAQVEYAFFKEVCNAPVTFGEYFTILSDLKDTILNLCNAEDCDLDAEIKKTLISILSGYDKKLEVDLKTPLPPIVSILKETIDDLRLIIEPQSVSSDSKEINKMTNVITPDFTKPKNNYERPALNTEECRANLIEVSSDLVVAVMEDVRCRIFEHHKQVLERRKTPRSECIDYVKFLMCSYSEIAEVIKVTSIYHSGICFVFFGEFDHFITERVMVKLSLNHEPPLVSELYSLSYLETTKIEDLRKAVRLESTRALRGTAEIINRHRQNIPK